GNAGDDAQGAAEAAGKAVSAVSGDQILKAIVDAAGATEGKGANEAKNAVEAAIGADDGAAGVAFGAAGMQNKNDQIAAAIVLRGLAKGGKFANANAANTKVVAAVKSAVESGVQIGQGDMHKAVDDTAKAGGEGGNESIANVAAGGNGAAGAGAKADAKSVTGIAKGMKAIVDAAGKAGVELKADAAGGAGGGDAGKLFASGGNANAGDDAQGAAEAAGKAVSAVSGDQILKAIVDAAGATEGKKADEAANAVEAAIGADDANGAAAAFGDAGIGNKNDQIAAAIVLRGLAKGGKFANANAANTKVVAAVKSAVESGVQIGQGDAQSG
uniref:variable large family protein n=1 Tax=Borreliella bavariensis TaxID=664662 RepID=UPI001C008F13